MVKNVQKTRVKSGRSKNHWKVEERQKILLVKEGKRFGCNRILVRRKREKAGVFKNRKKIKLRSKVEEKEKGGRKTKQSCW